MRRSKDGKQAYCKECRRENNSEFRSTHPTYQRDYFRSNRYQNLKNRLNTRLYIEYERQNVPRENRIKADQLLGLQFDLFINWLDFTKQYYVIPMYNGDTEIDHVVPLSFFNLNDPEQLSRATHWSNMRFITGNENRIKSSNLPSMNEIQAFNQLVLYYHYFITRQTWDN